MNWNDARIPSFEEGSARADLIMQRYLKGIAAARGGQSPGFAGV